MKKSKLAAILYYFILIGGACLFFGFIIIGSLYYDKQIQNFCANHRFIAIIILFAYFATYLYGIKSVVSTKAFKEWEKEVLKKTKRKT